MEHGEPVARGGNADRPELGRRHDDERSQRARLGLSIKTMRTSFMRPHSRSRAVGQFFHVHSPAPYARTAERCACLQEWACLSRSERPPALLKMRSGGGDHLRHGAADRVRTKLRIAHFKEIDHESSGGRMRRPVVVCLRPGRMGELAAAAFVSFAQPSNCLQ
jgi:hypothetical protein